VIRALRNGILRLKPYALLHNTHQSVLPAQIVIIISGLYVTNHPSLATFLPFFLALVVPVLEEQELHHGTRISSPK